MIGYSVGHPLRGRAQHGALVGTADIESVAYVQNDDYELQPTYTIRYASVPAQLSAALPTKNQVQQENGTSVEFSHVVSLSDYCPDVEVSDRVIISRRGNEPQITLDTVGIAHNSQATRTQLYCRMVTH